MSPSQAKRQETWTRLGVVVGAPRDTRTRDAAAYAPAAHAVLVRQEEQAVLPCHACGHPHPRGAWCKAEDCMCLVR
jgi:hypothetical protein